MRPLLIRADAGNRAGTGHIMRMLALAQACKRRGHKVIFACAECPPALIERIKGEGFHFRRIECVQAGDASDITATIEASSEWVVLDGYHFDEAFHQACLKAGRKILTIDDHGHCEHWHCDLILNQNFGAKASASYPENPLLGVSYALLRQEFLKRPRNQKDWAPLQKILITLGGADPPNATQWILEQLADLKHSELQIRVLVGAANPHSEALAALKLPFEVEFKESVRDMPAEYAWADGVISAGGSSCWEWLYFGLPGAVITIADNQEPVVTELEKNKLALCLGWPDQSSRRISLATWLDDPSQLIEQSAATSLIDGRGADRVISKIDGTDCIIRQCDATADAKFTFDLANHPSVRSAGYSTEEIPWETHCSWLEQQASPDCFLYIIEASKHRPVGTLRFRRSEDAWEIGIALLPEARGRNYADKGIQLGMEELKILQGIHHFTATIRPTNTPSKNLFQRLGFSHQSTEGDRETWTYHLS